MSVAQHLYDVDVFPCHDFVSHCMCRKKLFVSVHNFVHLNLSTALLIALIVFVSGIETGVNNRVSLSSHTLIIFTNSIDNLPWSFIV